MEEKSIGGYATYSLESPWATSYWKQGKYSTAKYCHISLEWFSFGCWEEYCSGSTQNSHGMSHSGRIWWLREQNILSALSPWFPAPSMRSLHWPYNNKAVSPIYSGEIPGVSGNVDLQYILFQKLLLTYSEQWKSRWYERKISTILECSSRSRSSVLLRPH